MNLTKVLGVYEVKDYWPNEKVCNEKADAH